MNTAEQIAFLSSLGESVEVIRDHSFYPRFSNREHLGWISIYDEGERWFIMWTTSKDTHNPHQGPALALSVRKTDGSRWETSGLSGAWLSALTMWPAIEPEEISKIESRVRSLVDTAYDWHHVRNKVSRA